MQDTTANLTIASPFRRTGAYLIDGMILALFTLAAGGVGVINLDKDLLPTDVRSLVTLLLCQAAYNIGFVATRSATPGKMALQIVVCDREGKPVRPDTAILRYVVLLIGNLVLVGAIASVVLVVIDKRRRTVHDRLAGTLVVKATPPEDNYPSSGARAR